MYPVLKFIARFLVLVLTRFQVRGAENIPRIGPVLVVANHLSVADPVILGISLRRQVIFLAKEELFRNLISRFFVTQFGAIPVHRGKCNRDALRMASRVLQQGRILGMFPEGKRSKEATLQPALHGSALMASLNRVPVLPVGIIGTETIRQLGWLWRRPRVVLNIGRPFYLPEAGDNLTRKQLEEFTGTIMKNISLLLPEKYRGEYSERRR